MALVHDRLQGHLGLLRLQAKDNLDSAVATLLVNVAITFAVFSVLEHTCDADNNEGSGAYKLRVSIKRTNMFLRRIDLPTAPKTAVKMSLTNWLLNEVMGAAQPFSKAAAAGLGQKLFVTKAGAVLLK